MKHNDVPESQQADTFGLKYIDTLYGYALMLTLDRVEAEELVQDHVLALKGPHQLRDNRNIKVWIFTILRDLWLNQLPKRKSESHLVKVDGQGGGAGSLREKTCNSQEILLRKEDAEQVQVAIAQLSTEFWRSFRLIWMEMRRRFKPLSSTLNVA